MLRPGRARRAGPSRAALSLGRRLPRRAPRPRRRATRPSAVALPPRPGGPTPRSTRRRKQAEATLRASAALQAKRPEWDAGRRCATARSSPATPRAATATTRSSPSATSTATMADALQGAPRCRDDAVQRLPRRWSPSTRAAASATTRSGRRSRSPRTRGDRKRARRESGRAYLDAFPEGQRAAAGQGAAARSASPAAPLPSPAPAGPRPRLRPALLERRLLDPRRARPRAEGRAPVRPRRQPRSAVGRPLAAPASTRTSRSRVFPVGDGLLEQVRIGQNRDDVVRVVLDFKDV